MVRVFVPLPSRHCKYASLALSGGSGMSVERDFAFQRPAGKVHPALVGEGGVSAGTHTFCKRTAYPCMPFLAK